MTLALIVYKPGWGGHLVERLLSLDESTRPVCFNSDIGKSRKEMYSFKEHEIGKWREGHKGFPDWSVLLQRHKEKLDKYPLSVVAIHPYELFGKVPYLLFNKKVMHFQISVHPDLMYVIDRFKKANNGFPVLRNTENTQSLAYYQGCNPFVINFDAFLKGEETFVAEYERIHTHFPAPMHLDDALELYRDWYIARKVSSFLEPQ